MDDLDNVSIADATAIVGSAVLQMIPAAGPMLAEILKVTIPNQRLDRAVNFVRVLRQELDSLKVDLANVKANNSILIEDGILLALRTNSQDQYRRAARVIAEGLSMKDEGLAEQRFLLSLLGELSEAEVVWLGNAISRLGRDQHDYRGKHKNVLGKTMLSVDSTSEERAAKYIVDGYHSHLERLGLVSPVYEMQGKLRGNLGDGKYENVRLKPRSFRATDLGELLYKKIEGVDKED